MCEQTPLPSEKRRLPWKVGSRDGEGHAVDTGLAQEGAGTTKVAAESHHGTALVAEADSGGVGGTKIIRCANLVFFTNKVKIVVQLIYINLN